VIPIGGFVASLWLLAVGVASAQTNSYVIQIEDELAIRVFQHPEVDETVKVLPDGTITVPLANGIRAAGATVDELQSRLAGAYSKYFRDPKVAVIVRTVSNRAVFVGGEVARAGLVPLTGQMTVLQAIMYAGGMKTTARTDNVYLIRKDATNQAVASRINMRDVLEKGAPALPVQSFDVIYVPMSKVAKVNVWVDQYLRQTLPVDLNAGFTYLTGSSAVIRFQ
jgi:polysaccharide export outer membrane protein